MKVVDLFCGVGGLSLGFKKAGFEIVGSFDAWEKAIQVYRLNFKHDAQVFDLSNVNETVRVLSELSPNIIIGGPPCQDFSHAGKRKEGGRANLTHSFAQIVCSIKPEFFVMENVDRAQKSVTYQTARTLFSSAGYGLTEIVLNASLCGVPQKRRRFFCIGNMGAPDHFLTDLLLKNMSKTQMTVRQYFKSKIDFEHYYRHPRNYNRRGVFSIDEPAPTIRGVNRPVPPNYPGHSGDTCAISEVRALTSHERAQIQTFPKNFRWIGGKTDVEQMIGNAVPVNLAKFVAVTIKEYAKI